MRVLLRELRKRDGLTEAQVAALLGVSYSHYSQIENGVKNPSLPLALRIKKLYNYYEDDIFLDYIAPNKAKSPYQKY